MIATPNPQAAPTAIMPSSPRLSTPARSTTSSPSAAISSGVAAVMTVMRTASAIPIRHGPPTQAALHR